MSYLLAQILVCLLIAGLIGAVIGWLLRGGCKDKLRELSNKWSARYDTEKAVWQGKIDSAEAQIEKSVQMNNDEWDTRLRDLESSWERKVQALVGNYDSQIGNFDKERETLENELKAAKEELTKTDTADKELKSVRRKAQDTELKLRDIESSYEEKLKAAYAEIEATKAELAKTDEKWSLKLKDTESNWEGKLQGVMSDFSSKTGSSDEELKALNAELEAQKKKAEEAELRLRDIESSYEDKLKSAQAEIESKKAELAKTDEKWSLKLKDTESSWENRLQGVMSDYDLKLSQIDQERANLKSDLEATKAKVDEAESKLIEDDAELFGAVGHLDECYELEAIEGIGAGFGKRFRAMGINNSCEFADRFLANATEIKKAAKETKIEEAAISAWASMADLMRLPGVDGQYAEIMQTVGVDSRDELTKTDPKTLHAKMKEYNAKNPIVPDVPGLGLLIKWTKSPDNSKIVKAVSSVSISTQECHDIEEIEGIGPGYGKKLRALDINTTCDLADKCLIDNGATKKVAKKLKVDFDAVRAWASMADLMRLPGVDGQYAEIMQVVGVNSRKELTQLSINSLYKEMKEFNSKNPIVPEVPTIDILKEWVTAAKKH